MSAFSPLNLVQDTSTSKKDLEEEHTRELEIENIFTIYQKAISLQSQSRWTEAYVEYKRLASSAVVLNHFYEEVSFIKGFQNGSSNLQPDELSLIPQNVKKIRFLFFRNRSFLHFNILKAGQETITEILQSEKVNESDLTQCALEKDLFYTMLDGFVNCLVYDEADESILRILFDIYTYLGVQRLAKYTLEYAVSCRREIDDNTSVLSLGDWAQPLWDKYKNGEANVKFVEELDEKLHFLLPLKADFVAQAVAKLQLNLLNVTLKPNPLWLDVISGVNSALKDIQDKERVQDFNKISLKHLNPYLTSDSTFDTVSFIFKGEIQVAEPVEVITIEDVPPLSVSKEAIAKEIYTITEMEPSIREGEKSAMRLSKRLNPGDSAPVYADDILLVRRYFFETEGFFNLLNEFFKSTFHADAPVLHDIVGHIVNTDLESTEPGYFGDFLSILNEWKARQYDTILFPDTSKTTTKTKSDTKKLIEVLTSFGDQFSESQESIPNVNDLQDHTHIMSFLSNSFDGQFSIDKVKLKILSKLMKTINTTIWGRQLRECVLDWVMQLECSVFETCEQCLKQSGTICDLSLATGIYEVLVNAYISIKETLEHLLEVGAHVSFVKSVKANYNTTAIEFMGLKDKIEKWSNLFKAAYSIPFSMKTTPSEIEFIIRYFWSTNYYISSQSFSWKEKNHVLLHLQTLSDNLTTVTFDKFRVAYPNLPQIGEFSFEGLHNRLSTTSILSTFSRILDQSDSESISTNDIISLLESILFDEDTPDCKGPGPILSPHTATALTGLDKVSLSSVREFFCGCPVDLKLSLWNILFSYYQKESFSNFQKGLEHYLSFVIKFLGSSSYTKLEEDKSTVLLGLICTYRKHLATFLQFLSCNKWQLPLNPASSVQLKDIAKIFELCYTFSLHEEAALYTSKKVSVSTKSPASFEYFKDFFIDSIAMLSVYCFNYIKGSDLSHKDTEISSLLRLLHNQLGLRHLCDSSKGIFLKLAEDCLITLDKVPETDLTQIMSCRYHYRVKLNNQFPVDHYTVKSADLNKQSAEDLALFILPLCFRANPLTNTPRNDLKQVVDDLFEIIGDPIVDHDRVLSGNLVTIERFIGNTFLGPRFIKEAFYGLKRLDIRASQSQNKVAEKGLYFLEAVLLFNTYRMRKKIAQSRIVELERIIEILIYDLVYGSDRVESWILLAQAYGYMVEDDLVWTSDKINAIDRKFPTANLQRKSLVCYLMAVSTFTRHNHKNADTLKPVMNLLMNSFAKELYSASRSPMDMLAFQVHSTSKFVRQKDQALFLKTSENSSVSQNFCLILANKCFDLAVKSNSDDWNSLYYAAKVKAKLNHVPTEVLDILARSAVAAKIHGAPNDPILEPSYKMLSLMYKYVRAGALSVDDGIKYLNNDPNLAIFFTFQGENKMVFFQSIVVCLKKLLLLDKRGWYHKPAYLQAKITFVDFGRPREAKDILSKFFTLKSNSKTFLQLWKPENERPGKHFVYMYQYTKFFIQLLNKEQDLSSLILLYPKLRRANSIMLSLSSVWEDLCSVICSISKQVINIDSDLVRHFLASTPYSTFMGHAKAVVDTFHSDGEICQKHIAFLHVITDMRKLNNGFGPTSSIDNTLTGIFIQILLTGISKLKASDVEIIPDSPNGKSKKLAKRDVFPFAVQLATKFKRDMDSVIKVNSELFNKYVSEYEKEAEELRRVHETQEMMQSHANQIKFSRRFAEQLLLRDQRKAMHKMLSHLVPERNDFKNNISQVTCAIESPQNSIGMRGSEILAANFNKARRIARNTNHQYTCQATLKNQLPLSNYSVGSTQDLKIGSASNIQEPNNHADFNHSSIPPAGAGEVVSCNVGLTVPNWHSTETKIITGDGNFQGTFEDPVEIYSDENETSESIPKRRCIENHN